MAGFVTNIEQATLDNSDFRRVLFTTKNSQLVVMSVPVGEEIGMEVHELDQFIRVEAGQGKVVLNGDEHPLNADDAVVIPKGTNHNVINVGNEALKLYTIYTPPEHRHDVVHKTKPEAEADDEHFDGVTSE